MELSDTTKWSKCQIRDVQDVNLTKEEALALSNVKNPTFECHSETCDAGGHCDLGRKQVAFNMIMKYPYDARGDSLKQIHLKLKEQIPSINPFFGFTDGHSYIRGKVDKRELLLWLKKMETHVTYGDDNLIIVFIPDDSQIRKLLVDENN